MRDIKFRAWEKNLKAMISVDSIDLKARLINMESAWRMFEEIEIMQYTGNNDKKDVEIYENDIVEDEYNRKYVVVFKGDCWRCEPLSKGLKNRWISNHLMVIGNVYSSPELLENN